MKSSPPRFVGPRHDARSLALQVLIDSQRHDAFVQELLDRAFTQHPLPPNDRRLTTQLVYGVLRRRGTFHALLKSLVTRGSHKVEPWLWDTLYLGACQLALLSHVPPFAAIHETVELAARFGRPAAKGFLNGVLRSLAALLTDQPADRPAPDALPLEGGAFRLLARPVFPDPATHSVEYLSSGLGLPRWLVQRWLERYGFDETLRLGFWFAGPAPLTLRVNPLRTTRDQFLAACAASNVAAEAGAHPQAVRLRESAAVRELPGYGEGWFTVQDESAMRVGSALAPEPGATVLDLCAAPGGKTAHLAELMQNRGRIVACDIDPSRLETVRTLAQRLGITIIETRLLRRTTTRRCPPARSTRRWWTRRAATPACWAAARKCDGACGRPSCRTWSACSAACSNKLLVVCGPAAFWYIRRAASNPKRIKPSRTPRRPASFSKRRKRRFPVFPPTAATGRDSE